MSRDRSRVVCGQCSCEMDPHAATGVCRCDRGHAPATGTLTLPNGETYPVTDVTLTFTAEPVAGRPATKVTGKLSPFPGLSVHGDDDA